SACGANCCFGLRRTPVWDLGFRVEHDPAIPHRRRAVSEYVFDVAAPEFEAAVVAASHDRPIIVDFWAPWCGPCRSLSPILERVVADQGGAVLMAKVNTDEAPHLARRYGVRGIPTVKAFRDGGVVDEFTGAAPEASVRTFVAALAPDRHADVLAEAGALIDAGQMQAARRLLANVPRTDPAWPQVDALLARADLDAMAAAAGERDSLAARLRQAPEDATAQLGVALHDLSAGRWSAGLEAALALVRHPDLGDTARQGIITAFRAMDDVDAVRRCQSRLANTLF
ncbi:MAG: thioredoxin, partial [Anaerolineae bacterium]